MATSIVPKDREQLSAGTARILDASRAIAAFAVLLQHARSALLVDPKSATRSNVATTILYWASGFGHQAVVIFFVLSGALVGGSVLRSVSSEEWSWRAYLIRRLSRLYIVLIPALLLILLWDGLGAAIFPAHGIYGDVMSAITLGGHTLIVHNRGAMAYAGNIAFLMTIYVPVLGSGAALWSLSNEFWYYILFPCMVLAVARRCNSWRSLAYVVLTFAIILFVSRGIVEWMSVWLLGIAAVRAPRFRLSSIRGSWLVIAAFMVFAVTTALERTIMNVISLRGDLAVGVGFALLLYCALCRDSSEPVAVGTLRLSGTWKRFAGFSYTLYLFHQPPLAFANAWLSYTHHSRWQPTAPHVATMFGVIAAIVLYSYFGSRVTEAHTDDLRSALAYRYAGRRHVRSEPTYDPYSA